MSKAAIAALSILMFCGLFPNAATSTTTDEAAAKARAVKAADRWLKLVDDGKYGESWTQASSLFKDHVTEDQWAQEVGAARKPIGSVISRKVASAHYMTSLPGAPDGDYFVIRYQTSFENKRAAVETVTPMLDKDGRWRVSGYYIR
jgi:hypothetical protein